MSQRHATRCICITPLEVCPWLLADRSDLFDLAVKAPTYSPLPPYYLVLVFISESASWEAGCKTKYSFLFLLLWPKRQLPVEWRPLRLTIAPDTLGTEQKSEPVDRKATAASSRRSLLASQFHPISELNPSPSLRRTEQPRWNE